MQIKEFQSEENAGERIDKFLTEKVPELSRSYIQKLIKEKNVKGSPKGLLACIGCPFLQNRTSGEKLSMRTSATAP